MLLLLLVMLSVRPHWLFLLVSLLLIGCSSTGDRAETAQSAISADAVGPYTPTGGQTAVTEAALRQQLEVAFLDYQGIPYRFGGSDRQGMDCSALIGAIYGDVFAMAMPRTTRQLAEQGLHIEQHELKAGDLVFFHTGPDQHHAGIYLDNGQFIHASSSKGVIKSRLDNVYWRQRYWHARRYF